MTSNKFDKLINDIVALRIQGAENVARAAIAGIADFAEKHPRASLKKAAARLIATRPTEPMMRNALSYFLAHAKQLGAARIRDRLLTRFDEADTLIADYAAGLIREGGRYATHCHSSTVVAAFLKAKRCGKRFTVANTETRPRFQGRITATQLAAAGIPVTHAVDGALRSQLEGCDAVFLGADALLSDGSIANKIGSALIAEVAARRHIPLYILASSWKHDTRSAKGYAATLERRPSAEVWPDAPRGVKVENVAFEIVDGRRIEGIVTEFGIRAPTSVIEEIKRHHRWRVTDEKKR